MADVSGPPKTKGMAATLSTQSLVSAWEQFLTDYYKLRIEEAALNYPETRSVDIDYNDLDRRDPNLAQYLLDHPRASIQSSEEALRLIEVPVEPRPALRVRVKNIPRQNRYQVRKLRAEHLGKFVAVEGLIKKVVEVRPKLKDATFQCQRCGAVFNVQQEDQILNEPKSCDEGQGGCGRDGPFKLLTEESKFIDSQKVEIQESHEDLRGGAQPERITVYLEEDLTGKVYPGDSIVINGVFRAQQRRQGSLKLAEFIKVIDCVSYEVQQMEFEEIEIKAEDIPEIEKISKSADVYKTIRDSFAPEIYGMEKIKDSLILSLFGGVAKEFKDGTRIRGDIHCLLVGDPGVAKCMRGDTTLALATGERPTIGALVEEAMRGERNAVDDGWWAPLRVPVYSMDTRGRVVTKWTTKAWKRTAPDQMIRVKTRSGRSVEVTPTHPLFMTDGVTIHPREAGKLRVGEHVAVPRRLPTLDGKADLTQSPYVSSRAKNAVRLSQPNGADSAFWHLAGLVLGDGNVTYRPTEGRWWIEFTNETPELNAFFAQQATRLGLNPSASQKTNSGSFHSWACGVEASSFLANLGLSETAAEKHVPASLTKAGLREQLAFLSGLLDTDGHVSKDRDAVDFSTASRQLAEGIQDMLLRAGVQSVIHEKHVAGYDQTYWRVMALGENARRLARILTPLHPGKKEALGRVVETATETNSNVDIVPVYPQFFRDLREGLGLAQDACGIPRGTWLGWERGEKHATRGTFEVMAQTILEVAMEKTGTEGSQYLEAARRMATLATSDLFWDEIVALEPVAPAEAYVYDLEVPDTHNFIANGIVNHNSQLLRYLSKLSPRSIYTSGKGTSAAGLTATAVRDEFGEGQWSLEAGALVLADKGVACLHPDSEVLIGGHPRRVADLFDPTRAMNAKTTSGGVLELAPLIEPTVNLDLGRLETRTPLATLVTRRRLDGKMMRVRLSSGFELKVTPDHLVLSGKDLRWQPIADFRVGDPLVAVQRLPSRRQPVYILDIVPDDWIVTPSADERAELRTLLEERFDTLAAANQFFGLSRAALSGRDAFTVRQFRHVLRHVGVYDAWRGRPMPFGRSKAGERLLVSTITPDLAYVLGFIYGDGNLSVDAKHSHVGVTQSTVNEAQVQAFAAASARVFADPWHDDVRVAPRDATIRGAPVHRLRRGSNLLAFVADWVIADGLANLLKLDDVAVGAFVAGALDSDGCVSVRTSRKGSTTYENVAIEFALSADRQENLRFLLALRRLDVFARLRPAAGVYHVEITNRADTERLLEAVRAYSVKFRTLPPKREQVGARHERIPASRTSALLSSIGASPAALLADGTWSTFYDLREGRRTPTKSALARVIDATNLLLSGPQREEAEALLRCDYALDQIESIVEESYSGYVYDLRVPDGEQFLCDGVVVHNCIDELDKMDENDQSAMHQAMEQQEISVSKAGISATLKSRCAVIGAANPKTGRFDDFAPIVQQINMPPPLLSRFDLIFGLRDRPNKEQDERIARHILGTHRAGEVHMARKRQPDGSFTEAQEKSLMARIEPVVPEKTLRKYVAYAKRNFYPVLTEEAANSINAFYQTLRNQASGTIGITPRQIEAIIRLAEASAKIRLSTDATQEDANRAISIFTEFLKTVGWNDESGTIDIDIIAAGASSSQQERMRKVLDLIRRLNSESAGEGAKLADVLEQAQMSAPPIPADRVEEAIRILKERGSIFQPRGDRYAPL